MKNNNTQNAKLNMTEYTQVQSKPNETGAIRLQGHIKIFDPTTKEVLVDKRNAIHYENFSIALASGIGNIGTNFISEMAFGNGGSRIDPTGIITYLTPNSTGTNATLYNQTYSKIVDDRSVSNLDPQNVPIIKSYSSLSFSFSLPFFLSLFFPRHFFPNIFFLFLPLLF